MTGHILEEYLDDRIRACTALAVEAENDEARETYENLARQYREQKQRISERDRL